MRKTTIAYVKASLRRTWGRSKQRQSALKSARISRGLYRCAHCKNVFRRKEIEVDHRIAVGKFVSFDLFIERLFCDSSGLDVVCRGCHLVKTASDRKKTI